MNELTKLHTDFVSIKEQFDTRTPMGRAMMFIASVFAQLEKRSNAEKNQRQYDRTCENRQVAWRAKSPTGFDSEKYEIVDIYEKIMTIY